MKPVLNKQNQLLPYLFILSGIFIIVQALYIILNNPLISQLKIVSSKAAKVSASIWFASIIYCLEQLLLYALFTLIVWGITRLAAQFLKLSWLHTCRLGFILWGLSVGAILLANGLFFPNSIFTKLIIPIYPHFLIKITFMLAIILLAIATIFAAIRLMQIIWRSRLITQTLIVMLITILTFAAYKIYKPITIKPNLSSKPNIIIIGIDALRPDHVGYYTHQINKMPALSRFLAKSTNFMRSITPQAQTSPAWLSILTGQYPKHNGTRFIFPLPEHSTSPETTLATILQKQGYTTIYSIDDWRYDSVNKNLGFDKLIGLIPDIDNFLLGSINDFPLSNLIINTRLGSILFPYSYGNRAAYITYKPEIFVSRIQKQLRKTQHRPIFLAVHLCLPHWPYLWASSATIAPNNENLAQSYDLAIRRADNQFKNLLSMLHHNKLLDNAIVIVMSDHGEGLDLPGDRVIARKNYIKGKFSQADIFNELKPLQDEDSALNVSVGHGNDVLSLSQYNNVLAFHIFGKKRNIAQNVSAMVSLIDIEPTILALLKLPSTKTDGQSLSAYIEGGKINNKPRMMFVESGFSPPAIKEKKIPIEKVLKQSLTFFDIDNKTSKLTLNPQIAPTLLQSKQRAVYYNDWILAFYPTKKGIITPILANQKTGKWTDDLQTQFAKKSPLNKMLIAMKAFYGKELG
jgi:arylsulfatase A-like enzyme